jgi:MFS family permease
MAVEQYSVVTAVFTVGGLCGSLLSSGVTRRVGLQRAIALTGWLNAVGAVIMGLSVHWLMLAAGRCVRACSDRFRRA